MLTMNDQRARNRKLSLQQIERFLAAAKEVRFEASERKEIYSWIERLLCHKSTCGRGRRARGLLRRYIGTMTGLSRPQVTRLLARYVATGQVRIKNSRRHIIDNDAKPIRRRGPKWCPSASAVGPIPTGDPATYASIPCTR
jgi:CRP-like cAMP-binding protein